MAAAGLWTTPSDFARFAIELQVSVLGKSNRVLSSTTSDLMLTPHSIVPADLGVLTGDRTAGLGFSSMAKNVRDGSVIPAEMLDTSPI